MNIILSDYSILDPGVLYYYDTSYVKQMFCFNGVVRICSRYLFTTGLDLYELV